MNKNKIKKALETDRYDKKDVIEKMKNLGYELVGYSQKYPDDYYFINYNCQIIIFVSYINCEFNIYQKKEKIQI